MDITHARQSLQILLERYDTFKDDKGFLSNEKQICESLILPVVRTILHWNTEDPSEFRLEEQRAGKRPDYLVYYQGMTQFIVEAKSATKNLFEDNVALKQALEYGYNADKDFVLLTNFRQIVILAPKIQYRNVHEAAIARIDLLHASDDDLQIFLGFEKEYWISSAKNNLLYQKIVHHKKSVPVDNRLLDDMKNWRQILLTNIQKQNHKLNFDDEQDFAEIEKEIQKFIDRLVFICCCEDKGIHHEPTLKRLLNEKISHYAMSPGWLLNQIRGLFTKYRKIPDSDLFDASPADKYIIEDIKLIEVLTDLREPKSRPAYNFDEIDEDILGKVYENFIGHVQTGKKRFKEKEDLGKRKKEGIYYTPKYIVEYIVNNTVYEYIKDKSFDEILKVKILDPACGSGSFLLRAFNVLVEEGAKALKRPLMYAEKKNLLLSCIYGVDLDERAVEITKLTFSLKLAQISEGLPVLADNIRHGNSLIDDKAIAGEYLAFKWEDEFKDIMKNGGFDIVIGNPPWLMAGYHTTPKEIDYLHEKYASAEGKFDLYYIFIEKALKLISNNGIFGMIIPNKFFHTKSAKGLREVIVKSGKLYKIVDFGDEKVFGDATNYSSILLLKSGYHKKITYTQVDVKLNIKKEIQIDAESLTVEGWCFEDKIEKSLFDKIKNIGTPLTQITKRFGTGVQTGADKVLLIKEENIKEFGTENRIFCKILRGRDVRRYSISKITKLAIFPYKVVNNRFEIFEEDEIKKYKRVWHILESNKNNLSKRIWFGKNATQLSGRYYGFMYLDSALGLTPQLAVV